MLRSATRAPPQYAAQSITGAGAGADGETRVSAITPAYANFVASSLNERGLQTIVVAARGPPPSCRMPTAYGSLGTRLTSRPAARHPRYADPADAAMGFAARVCDHADDPRPIL